MKRPGCTVGPRKTQKGRAAQGHSQPTAPFPRGRDPGPQGHLPPVSEGPAQSRGEQCVCMPGKPRTPGTGFLSCSLHFASMRCVCRWQEHTQASTGPTARPPWAGPPPAPPGDKVPRVVPSLWAPTYGNVPESVSVQLEARSWTLSTSLPLGLLPAGRGPVPPALAGALGSVFKFLKPQLPHLGNGVSIPYLSLSITVRVGRGSRLPGPCAQCRLNRREPLFPFP